MLVTLEQGIVSVSSDVQYIGTEPWSSPEVVEGVEEKRKKHKRARSQTSVAQEEVNVFETAVFNASGAPQEPKTIADVASKEDPSPKKKKRTRR